MNVNGVGFFTLVFLQMIVHVRSNCNFNLDRNLLRQIDAVLRRKDTDAVYLRPWGCGSSSGCRAFCATWVITTSNKGELTLSFSPLFKRMSLGMLKYGIKDFELNLKNSTCTTHELYERINHCLYAQFVINEMSRELCYADCEFGFATIMSNNYKCFDKVDKSWKSKELSHSAALTTMTVFVFFLLLKIIGLSQFTLHIEGVNTLPGANSSFISNPKDSKQFTIVHLAKNMLLEESYIKSSTKLFMSKKILCCKCATFIQFFMQNSPRAWFLVVIPYVYIAVTEQYMDNEAIIKKQFVHVGLVVILLMNEFCVLFFVSKLSETSQSTYAEKKDEACLKNVLQESVKVFRFNIVISILFFPIYLSLLLACSYIYREIPILRVSFLYLKPYFARYKIKICEFFKSVNCCIGYTALNWDDDSNDIDAPTSNILLIIPLSLYTLSAVVGHLTNTIWTIAILVNIVSYFLLGVFLNIQHFLRYIFIAGVIVLYLKSKRSLILKEYGSFYSDILKYFPKDEKILRESENIGVIERKDGRVKLSAMFFNDVCNKHLNGCPGPLVDQLAQAVVGTVLVAMMSIVMYLIMAILRMDMLDKDSISYWVNLGTTTFGVILWLVEEIFGLFSKGYVIPEDIAPGFKQTLEIELRSCIIKIKSERGMESEHAGFSEVNINPLINESLV